MAVCHKVLIKSNEQTGPRAFMFGCWDHAETCVQCKKVWQLCKYLNRVQIEKTGDVLCADNALPEVLHLL